MVDSEVDLEVDVVDHQEVDSEVDLQEEVGLEVDHPVGVDSVVEEVAEGVVVASDSVQEVDSKVVEVVVGSKEVVEIQDMVIVEVVVEEVATVVHQEVVVISEEVAEVTAAEVVVEAVTGKLTHSSSNNLNNPLPCRQSR